MLLLILTIVLLVLLLLLTLRQKAKKTPSHPRPMGERIYSDLEDEGEPLIDHHWGLVGKPDEIWRNNDRLHIVEIKSGHLPAHQQQAYPNHKIQLAVYMRVAEAHFKIPVKTGEIRYANGRRFIYRWDESMQTGLRKALSRFRKVEATGRTFAKVTKTQCQKCRYYSICEKKRFAK